MLKAKLFPFVLIFVLVLTTVVDITDAGAALAVTGPTGFDPSCSPQNIKGLITARNNASIYAANALAYFQSNTQDARYTTWFGQYDFTRYVTAQSNFSAISNAIDTASVLLICQPNANSGCTTDDYAIVDPAQPYNFPDQPYKINLCSRFWRHMPPTESQAAILLHEMSHFINVAGTTHAGGLGLIQAAVGAITEPSAAIGNAYNHQYFAQNVPSPLTNFARNKRTWQSSNFHDNFCPSLDNSPYAVDGDTNGDWNNCSVTHTQNDNMAWWQVDLKLKKRIGAIVIWNRTDSDPDRLSNFVVSLSSDCKSFQPFISRGPAVNISYAFRVNVDARCVKVQLQGTNFLSLAEVQVFGW